MSEPSSSPPISSTTTTASDKNLYYILIAVVITSIVLSYVLMNEAKDHAFKSYSKSETEQGSAYVSLAVANEILYLIFVLPLAAYVFWYWSSCRKSLT